MNTRIADLLSRKGSTVHTVDRETTVFDAIKKMVDNNVGSLLVMQGDAIAGIFTERDYLRRIVLKDRTSKATRVMDVMTTRLIVVDPTCDVEECMSIMTRERVRHLPIMDGDKLAGLVSIGDVVKYLSHERKVEIRYLHDYITGRYPG